MKHCRSCLIYYIINGIGKITDFGKCKVLGTILLPPGGGGGAGTRTALDLESNVQSKYLPGLMFSWPHYV